MEFTLIFLLAIFVEGTVEYFVPESKKGEWVKYLAAAIGIALAFAYKTDLVLALINAADLKVEVVPYVGFVVTGIIIGRGSNYLNDLISRVRGEKKQAASVPMP